MPGSSANNIRIVKNTLYLYVRMFITMAIGLITSRVILKTLGVDDFGIYNIVGGVVILFSFISNSLRNATQRFLSYELGKKNEDGLRRVLNASITCHVLIGIVLLILSETVGLWFVKTQLNIPVERQYAADWVYQFSILTFLLHILQVPYNATIISYEKMSFYAYVSIVEVLLKLGIVYLLLAANWDKLIIYSALVSVVALIILVINAGYCRWSLKTGKLILGYDKDLLGKLMGFSGWSMINGSSVLFAQQGGNILLNIFKGISANAAFGIANQVTNAVYAFVSNFQYAFQPQIVKLYALGNRIDLYKLVNRTSSVSFYLLLLIAIPFSIEADYVIKLWLGTVPTYSANFCILMIVYFLLDSIQAPLWMLIYGTGNIKTYTLWTASLSILNIPISLILLKYGCSIYSVFYVRILLNVACCCYRFIYIKRFIGFPNTVYLKNVVLRASLVATLAYSVSLLIKHQQLIPNIHPILIVLLSIIITFLSISVFGFCAEDRIAIKSLIKSKFSRGID